MDQLIGRNTNNPIFEVDHIQKNLIDATKKKSHEFQRRTGRPPCLVVVGLWDAAAISYVKQICSVAKKCHIEVATLNLCNFTISSEMWNSIISGLSQDNRYDAILVQTPIPIPDGIEIINRHLDWKKDVDGLTATNLGRSLLGIGGFTPCTAEAIFEILIGSGTELKGKLVVVVNDSAIIGKPLASLLSAEGATVCVCNRHSGDYLSQMLSQADVIVSATGVPDLIQPGNIKDRVVIIDAGICNVGGTIRGDVSENVAGIAHFRTRVPGGVGKITTAILMKHVCDAALSFHNFEDDFLNFAAEYFVSSQEFK